MVTALGVHRVLRDPELAAAVRADPDALPGLVDEPLRLDPGAAATVDRVVRARGEVELGGRTFAGGDVLVLPLGAANRDPDVFTEPDRIDPYRRPNPHVTFFPGPHHCVGAALARTVLGATIGALLEHPAPIARGGEPAWGTGVLGETQLTAATTRRSTGRRDALTAPNAARTERGAPSSSDTARGCPSFAGIRRERYLRPRSPWGRSSDGGGSCPPPSARRRGARPGRCDGCP